MMREKRYCLYCGTELVEKFCEGALRKYCNRCNEPIYENPIPATCLVVVDTKDRVLLVKRSVAPKKGFWCLPGGFMELGETPEQAALRELKEETGISGAIDRLLGVTSSLNTIYGSVLLVGYLVKDTTGMLRAANRLAKTTSAAVRAPMTMVAVQPAARARSARKNIGATP